MKLQTKRGMLLVFCLLLCVSMLASCLHLTEDDFPFGEESDRTSDVTSGTDAPESTVGGTTTGNPPEVETPERETETTTQTPQRETTTPEPETSTPKPETTTPEPETSAPEPETSTPSTDVPVIPIKKIKIYIDQGHNPFSPTHPPSWNTGASNEELGLYEQDLTYEIGMLLAELLSKDDRFEVRLSRPTPETILGTDNDSALDARVNDAATWGADYFISLHINSYSSASVNGLEVYTAESAGTSYDLGSKILEELIESTGLRSRGMKNGDHLRVLKNAKMPATLVEMGFISNLGDATLLDQSPELFAQGVYNGIIAYFASLQEKTE